MNDGQFFQELNEKFDNFYKNVLLKMKDLDIFTHILCVKKNIVKMLESWNISYKLKISFREIYVSRSLF